jgi:hypothetical protein
MNQPFKHHDKLAAIDLAERNSTNRNPRKSITVQHLNDAGVADSPAELVTTEHGHSPISMQSISGGHYVAIECDPLADANNWQNPQHQQHQQHSQQHNQQEYQQR